MPGPADTPRNFHGRRQSAPERLRKLPRGSRKAQPGGLGAALPGPRGTLVGEKDSAAHPPGQPGPRGSPHPSHAPRRRDQPAPACPRTSSASSSTRLPTSAMFPSAAAAHTQGTQNRLLPRLWFSPARVEAEPGGPRRPDPAVSAPPPAPRDPQRTQRPSGCRAGAPPPRGLAPPLRRLAPPPHAAP